MKIVLAGQLDRVYANAIARSVPDAGDAANDNTDDVQSEKDRLLFSRAGTLAALSESVVSSPDWYPLDDEEDEDGDRTETAARMPSHFAAGMSLTKGMWHALYDEAAGVAQAVDFFDGYTERALAALNDIDTPDAWIEDDSQRSLQRVISGTALAFLTDLLLQAFLAWQTRAVLVIAKADYHVLADIARFLVERDRPRPFPIPDLSTVMQVDNANASGNVLDLAPHNLADVDLLRGDPSVQVYARQVRSVMATPTSPLLGEGLADALATVRSMDRKLASASDDIVVTVMQAEVLSNEGVRVMQRKKLVSHVIDRAFAPEKLSMIVVD